MKIYQNVLSERTLIMMNAELDDYAKLQKWSTSSFIWSKELLVGVSGVCFQSYTSQQITDAILMDIAEALPKPYTEVITQYYCWEKNSAISMHKDTKWKFGATIYLNPTWSYDDGGIFIWQALDGDRAYKPEYNTMIVNDMDEPHMVTPVSVYAKHNRFTVQVWAK